MELDYKDDCGFSRENKWFRYRAGAIIIEDGHVLVASNDTSEYFYSVGGGVHLGENAEDAVIREVFEETGIRYQIGYPRKFLYGRQLNCRSVLPRGSLLLFDEIKRQQEAKQQ